MRVPDFTVSQFLGLNTFVKDLKTLKPGVPSSSKNWPTSKFGDHIALRRGTLLLGTGQTGAGKITGLVRWSAYVGEFAVSEDFIGGIACRMPRAIQASSLSATEHACRFGRMRCDCIHQRR
jgi:hypothetical protein